MKIVAISDIHNNHRKIEFPEFNLSEEPVVLAVGGDFTNSSGRGVDLYNFDNWLAEIKQLFTAIIYTYGNHEYSCYMNNLKLSNAILLDGDYFELEGIVFYGSAYSDAFGHSAIRTNILYPKIDILLTHYPPYGILDKWGTNNRGGSKKLLKDLTNLTEDLRPKYNIVGHLHEHANKSITRYGIKFISAAMCDTSYNFIKDKKPIIINI